MAVAEQMQLMHAALDELRDEERRLLEIETASSAAVSQLALCGASDLVQVAPPLTLTPASCLSRGGPISALAPPRFRSLAPRPDPEPGPDARPV